jgi:hypothetical protein
MRHGDGFEKHSRKARMEGLAPRSEFCALIEPYSYYPKAGNGRPPVGLDRMLRMYFLANWFNLADEACCHIPSSLCPVRDGVRAEAAEEDLCILHEKRAREAQGWKRRQTRRAGRDAAL